MVSSLKVIALSAFLMLGAGCMAPPPETDGAPDDDAIAESESALYGLGTALWKEWAIPVCWLDTNPAFASQRQWTQSAVTQTWEANSQVRFTGWGACPAGAFNGIKIRVADENPRSYLGTQGLGRPWFMTLNFTFASWSPSCASSLEHCVRSIAVHEFGHALGFPHEQNRPDTPQSCKNQLPATDVVPYSASFDPFVMGGWDLNSVMNYCNPIWNNSGQLSATDTNGLRSVYLNSNTIDATLVWGFYYIKTYSDLYQAFGGDPTKAVSHFYSSGQYEGRQASPLFDVKTYINVYSDLKSAFGTNYGAAVNHWRSSGLTEGRRSSLSFSVAEYLNYNADLKAAFGTNHAAAIQHYLQSGVREKRRTSILFDANAYFAYNPDLVSPLGNSGRAAIEHYERYGIYEGRRASADFSPTYYLNTYPDLKAAFGATGYKQAAIHWLATGRAEGRQGAP